MINEQRPLPDPGNDGVIQMAGMASVLMSAGEAIAFGVSGLDGRYLMANRAMTRLLYPGADSLVGKFEGDLLPATLVAELARCDQCVIDGAPAASVEIELPVNGQTRRCLCLRLPVLGAQQELQAIASIIHELSPPAESMELQQTLAYLQQANLELQQTVAELEQAASTDKLTGTWNRRRLAECVHNEMDRLNRYQHPLSMLLVDIDFFKAVNDRYGHGTGDQVLQTLAALLQGKLRRTDSLARWGGEEFVVLCPDTGRATAAMLAERLREQTASAIFPIVGQLTVSIGVAECTPGENWEQWFERTDEALYRAKRAGRNQIQIAPEPTAAAGAAAEYVVANFVQLVWRSAYESGNERVDTGHRQLFTDANDLLSAILSGQTSDRVDAIVNRLLADVLQHFVDEEEIITAAGFPGAAEHIVLHRQLVDQALALRDAYRAGKQGVGDMFQFLAYEVITKHMLGADRQFFGYLLPKEALAGRRLRGS